MNDLQIVVEIAAGCEYVVVLVGSELRAWVLTEVFYDVPQVWAG